MDELRPRHMFGFYEIHPPFSGGTKAVAAAEFENIPLTPFPSGPTWQWSGCTLTMTWQDSSDFEQGYRVWYDSMDSSPSLTLGPMNGGTQTVNIPTSPGKAYHPYIEVYAGGGNTFAPAISPAGGSQISTVPRASNLSVKQNGGGATLSWSLVQTSGQSFPYFIAKAQRSGSSSVLTSGQLQFTTTTPPSYTFSGVDTNIYSYTFWVEADSSFPQWSGCPTQSDLYRTNPPNSQPPAGYNQVIVYNASPVNVNIWLADATSWHNMGALAPGASPITIPLQSGQNYRVVAINSDLSICNGNIDPTNQSADCQYYSWSPFPGASNGGPLMLTVPDH